NAAQAHRLAGHDQRAVELYQSYLRLPGVSNRDEVERHIASLKAAMEQQRNAASAPPLGPAPLKASPEPGVAPVAAPAPAPDKPRVVVVAHRRPWIWALLAGAVVVAAVVVGVGAGVGARPADPTASLGAVRF